MYRFKTIKYTLAKLISYDGDDNFSYQTILIVLGRQIVDFPEITGSQRNKVMFFEKSAIWPSKLSIITNLSIYVRNKCY